MSFITKGGRLLFRTNNSCLSGVRTFAKIDYERRDTYERLFVFYDEYTYNGVSRGKSTKHASIFLFNGRIRVRILTSSGTNVHIGARILKLRR